MCLDEDCEDPHATDPQKGGVGKGFHVTHGVQEVDGERVTLECDLYAPVSSSRERSELLYPLERWEEESGASVAHTDSPNSPTRPFPRWRGRPKRSYGLTRRE